MTTAQILADAISLETWLSKRDQKYLRNLNRYNNNGQRREQIWDLYNDPVSYNYGSSEANALPWPIENVIKSCIDTKVSKMSQVKVRPFFNPVNGKWQTRKVCRIGQQWSDQWYQRERLYQLANLCYRDAQIFEVGHAWVDEETKKPRRLKPWEYFYDPAEYNFGHLSRVMIEFRQYPLVALKKLLKPGSASWSAYQQTPFYRAQKYRIYYLLEDGIRFDIVDDVVMRETKIKFTRTPVASIHYCPPVKGLWSPSLVDDLITLQRELDLVNEKIHDAEENTPANMIFVPTFHGIKASTLDAGKAGLVYEYEPGPDVTSPATVVTPASVNPQLLARRKEIIESMYNISGVSMLSAQSKKPSGINSGVMLDTLEDVESERFNRELQDFEQFLMQICEIAVDVFEGGDDLLPKRDGRSSVTWKDLQKEREYFAIQFSPASALSNTPKVKMEQVEKLQKMGLVGPEWAASMLEFPDLEKSYSIASANRDDIERITERAAEGGEFSFYEVVSLPDLYKNVMNEIMRLDADEENERIIDNLVKFINVLKGKIDDLAQAAAPPAPPDVPPAPPAAPPEPPPAAPPVMLGQPPEPIPQAPNVLAQQPPPGSPI